MAKGDVRQGTRMHAHEQRGADLYETPPEATQALIDACPWLPQCLWEPACGPGAMVKVLRDSGRDVVATDLVDYGDRMCPESEPGLDFLEMQGVPRPFDCSGDWWNRLPRAIVTNPPFSLADKFVRHGLTLCDTVVVLQRLVALEGKRRSDLIDGHLVEVLPFIERLPMLHRDGWDGPKIDSGAVPYAWFWFSRHKRGPTVLRRISCRPGKAEA
jgi:hypothetical protein